MFAKLNPRWLIIAVVLSYLLMLFGGGALKPEYSHISQFISELNATGSPFANTIGWFGFMPFGLLSLLLLFAVSCKAPVKGVSRFGYWLLIAEPIAYIGSTLAPCDAGCPIEGSTSQMLHNLLGLFTYLCTALGLFLLSFSPGITPAKRLLWIALSLIWLILFGLMVDASIAPFRGILQRLAEWIVYPALWICAWRISGRRTEATTAN